MKTDTVRIRWLIKRDIPAVMGVEQNCFDSPWTEDEILNVLRQRNAIGMVIDVMDEIAGFMIYELHKDEIRILDFAVDPAFRRQGLGARMVLRLKDKLSKQRRKRLVLDVRETNIGAQKFFRSQGFVAASVLRNWYEDTGEDAYHMRYSLTAMDDIYSPFSPKNRISED